MKVFVNKNTVGGLILVAAANKSDAHRVCFVAPELEGIYWEDYKDSNDNFMDRDEAEHSWSAWRELYDVIYTGDEPRILLEVGH